jgi:hypothetical protein
MSAFDETAYFKEYNQRPEVKARKKAYSQTQESKDRRKIRNQTPEQKAYLKKWWNSPKGRALTASRRLDPRLKVWQAAYQKTPKHKAYEKARRQNPKRKELKDAYTHSPRGKLYMKKYNQFYVHTQKGMETKNRMRQNRRDLGYSLLNEYFVGSEAHHIDRDHVLFIPKELHRSVWHSQDKLETMEKINTKVFCWLLGKSTSSPW